MHAAIFFSSNNIKWTQLGAETFMFPENTSEAEASVKNCFLPR